MISIAILEDDGKIRDYLVALLAGSEEFELAGAFGTAEEAMSFFEKDLGNKVELVLCDVQLPGDSGIDFIGWLKPLRSEIQFMVLSAFDDAGNVFKALEAGASGYMLKNTKAAKLIEGIHDLHRGGSPMSGRIARMVVSAFQQKISTVNQRDILSIREKEVLDWLSKGFTYKEIAAELFISVETVRTHLRKIYEKLHASNRSEALRKAGLR